VTCGSDRAGLAALAVIGLFASTADASPADDAFKQGRELFKAGKYAEACVAFQESQRLDPSLGTQFNIAQCEEKTGKLASALRIYKDLAQYDTNGTRKAAAADLADKLEPRVPKLQVQLSAKPAGIVVTVDGTACPACLTGTTPVDSGTITIVVKAPGFKDATATATIALDAKVTAVPIKLEPAAPTVTTTTTTTTTGARPIVAPPQAVTTQADGPPHSRRKTYAIVAVAGGGAVLATGVVFGILARGKWNDAKAVCGGSTTCPTDADTMRATALGDAASSRANVSTALVLAGGAIAAAGVVLYVTSPKERPVAISASVAPGTAGLTLAGSF
jgi:hypothetical protein